jgi:CRISPR-associated endonuclease Csn1
LVSHKKQKNILTARSHKTKKNGITYTNSGIAARGQLHKESVYGKRTAPYADPGYHIRKPIENLTTEKHLDKIVDKTIRTLVLKRIHELGGFEKGKIPEGTFYTTDENGQKQAQIFLPNKNGAPVPIKKIRIKENIGGAEQLKGNTNQYVNPRNNHHVLIYKDFDDNLKESVVTFWTVVERKRQNTPAIQFPEDGKEIVTTLQINDMFLLGLNHNDIDWKSPNYDLLKNHLYRVQKVSSKDYNFRKAKASTINKKDEAIRMSISSFFSYSPLKVKINRIGFISKF